MRRIYLVLNFKKNYGYTLLIRPPINGFSPGHHKEFYLVSFHFLQYFSYVEVQFLL